MFKAVCPVSDQHTVYLLQYAVLTFLFWKIHYILMYLCGRRYRAGLYFTDNSEPCTQTIFLLLADMFLWMSCFCSASVTLTISSVMHVQYLQRVHCCCSLTVTLSTWSSCSWFLLYSFLFPALVWLSTESNRWELWFVHRVQSSTNDAAWTTVFFCITTYSHPHICSCSLLHINLSILDFISSTVRQLTF